MMNEAIPTKLKLLAFMWFLFGVMALIATVRSIFDFNSTKVSLYLNLLGFGIANGLLKLKPEWRTCALAISYINIIAGSILILVMLFHGEIGSLWWIRGLLEQISVA